MKTWEGDEIHCKFPEIRVKLTREPKAACDTAHGCRDQVVQVTNCHEHTEIKANQCASFLAEASEKGKTRSLLFSINHRDSNSYKSYGKH